MAEPKFRLVIESAPIWCIRCRVDRRWKGPVPEEKTSIDFTTDREEAGVFSDAEVQFIMSEAKRLGLAMRREGEVAGE